MEHDNCKKKAWNPTKYRRGDRQPYGMGQDGDMDTLPASMWDLRGRRVDKLAAAPPVRTASVKMNGKINVSACARVSLALKKPTGDLHSE